MSRITLNTNIAALSTQRQLGESTSALQRSFTRLSSGLRINKASDDAAGLAIASFLNADSRVYAQGIRNVNDGISLLHIAEASLSELSNVLIRQGELAEQAANGTNSFEQRKALSKEAESLTEEYNRIVQSCEFNGIKLFDTAGKTISIQAGYGDGGQIAFNLGQALSRTVGDGTFSAQGTWDTTFAPNELFTGDFNSDGKLDYATNDLNSRLISVFLGNANGTFLARKTYSTDVFQISATPGDVNNDGVTDIVTTSHNFDTISVLLGNPDGSFSAGTSFASGQDPWDVTVGDLDGDGILDVVTASYTSPGYLNIHLGNGNGTFRAPTSTLAGATVTETAVVDFNNDGILDIAATSHDFGTEISVHLGRGDGTFSPKMTFDTLAVNPRSITAQDFNRDGFIDLATANRTNDQVSILFGDGTGHFSTGTIYITGDNPRDIIATDFNNDGFADIVTTDFDGDTISIMLNNGDGTFGASTSLGAGNMPIASCSGDFTGDGVEDIITSSSADNFTTLYVANTTQEISANPLYLHTTELAKEALTKVKESLERVTKELASIGSAQSRLEIAANNLMVAQENFDAAASQILDADIAEEAANLLRNRILQQAGAAVLGQANQLPALALLLLSDK